MSGVVIYLPDLVHVLPMHVIIFLKHHIANVDFKSKCLDCTALRASSESHVLRKRLMNPSPRIRRCS